MTSCMHACMHRFSLDDDKEYDGWDMAALLFTEAGQADDKSSALAARRDRYFYHSSEDNTGDLVAVRLGPVTTLPPPPLHYDSSL